MPKIFTTLDKIKPVYDITYKVVLFICKLLLIADILITTMSVIVTSRSSRTRHGRKRLC